MAHKLAPPHAKLLKEVTAASKVEPGFHYVEPNLAKHLETLGLIETNPDIKNAEGKVAARLVPTSTPSTPTSQPAALPVQTKGTSKVAFQVETGIDIKDLPKSSRDAKYPFSDLEVGASFFVPATDKSYKSLASAVATAQRRFSDVSSTETRINKKGSIVPVTTFTRKFSIRPVTAGHTYPSGKTETEDGSRVFRIV